MAAVGDAAFTDAEINLLTSEKLSLVSAMIESVSRDVNTMIQPVKYILETAFPVLKFHKLTAYKAFSIIKIEDEGTAS